MRAALTLLLMLGGCGPGHELGQPEPEPRERRVRTEGAEQPEAPRPSGRPPVAAPESAASRAGAAVRPPLATRHLRLVGELWGAYLIVEDEDSIRLTLRDYLKNKGYEVVVASDGVGAIKQLLDNPVGVIVSDYRMDILGGDYWIRFLKEYCTDKKIIITSGFLKPEFPIPFPVLYKPFDYSELETMVAAALAELQ